MALMEFVEKVANSSDLAVRFRERFEVAVVPLMNPDGVAAGHWRHNLNGVDLNRDWGPFTQPETRAVRDELLKYQAEQTSRLAFFLDFHSTRYDMFYVELGEEPIWPEDFPDRWLDALSARVPDYSMRIEPRPGDKPYSKTWVRQTLRVPAIIYEMGDDTDRQLIDRVATAAAEEMMRLLLLEAAREESAQQPDQEVEQQRH
jgi:predicted deacylase